eukprot:COSAG01_NODE_5335_length_4326_cov_9.032174_4_plen_187_part_00
MDRQAAETDVFTSGSAVQGDLWADYMKTRKYYELASARMPASVRDIVVIGSLGHSHEPNHNASIQYRDSVVHFFEARGYSVTQRWNGTPDSDFVYMSHAHVFVVSGGFYSRFAAQCVRQLGGHLVFEWNELERNDLWWRSFRWRAFYTVASSIVFLVLLKAMARQPHVLQQHVTARCYGLVAAGCP